jgi:hypothetical protein
MSNDIEDTAPDDEKKNGSWTSKRLCACIAWGFLAFAIAWATGMHQFVPPLVIEHYALTAGVVSVVLCIVTLDSESKLSEIVFIAANFILAASILYGIVWGWGSILLYDEIYGVKFLLPVVPSLAVEAAIAAVIFCAVWHSDSEELKSAGDRLVASGFVIMLGTGLVFAVAICLSVVADADRKAAEARAATQSLTREQRTEISDDTWKCGYNTLSRTATCVAPASSAE